MYVNSLNSKIVIMFKNLFFKLMHLKLNIKIIYISEYWPEIEAMWRWNNRTGKLKSVFA